jgi:hypothetical protein
VASTGQFAGAEASRRTGVLTHGPLAQLFSQVLCRSVPVATTKATEVRAQCKPARYVSLFRRMVAGNFGQA